MGTKFNEILKSVLIFNSHPKVEHAHLAKHSKIANYIIILGRNLVDSLYVCTYAVNFEVDEIVAQLLAPRMTMFCKLHDTVLRACTSLVGPSSIIRTYLTYTHVWVRLAS